MTNTSWIPEWMNSDIPLIYMVGQNTLKILNYKKILKYGQKEVVILLAGSLLSVCGNGLNIDHFDEDEICIQGCIISITYQGG